MLDWLFILLLITAILFFLLALESNRSGELFWGTVFILVDIVLWFVLGASVMNIEIPFQAYNATSGNIETNYQLFVTSDSIAISYFFMMMGAILMIYFVGFIFGPLVFEKLFPQHNKPWKK